MPNHVATIKTDRPVEKRLVEDRLVEDRPEICAEVFFTFPIMNYLRIGRLTHICTEGNN
jgi:hypothetical protein